MTSTLAFDGDGVVKEYAGGYAEWFAQRPGSASAPEKKEKKGRAKPAGDAPPKLTYKETRELADLPKRIEELEAEQAELFARTSTRSSTRGTPERSPG